MTDFEFLVAAMRKAQKDYFRSRSQNALQIAKDLEKKVDEYIKKAQRSDEEMDNLFSENMEY